MKKLAILGASGHGKVVADIALCSGWDDVVFFDDAWPQKSSLGPWQIVGDSADLIGSLAQYQGCVVAIGDNIIRYQKQKVLMSVEADLVSLVHPRAVVSPYAILGVGTVVMAGAILNPFAQIGDACIVNTGAIVEHDCQLADAVHLSPQVALAGGVCVGVASWLGIGSSVKQLVNIGAHVMVGAGSVVLADIADNSVVAGVPARPLL
ncbi:acetyltransferase [Desulfotalea psychrophila]|uniref:Probable pilin glycosylation protein n=1 Tax=Desulfotalea psychrophila (strain LSv54 / DSM 12343) TaxID=177439 RepID=Q6ASA5_DESPS|nr:acetyltransferase [Desulfotalea psychrophila]CAG34758.1 probable pilin glycosylation protein [Desulfotalea psychrophila LSv54]